MRSRSIAALAAIALLSLFASGASGQVPTPTSCYGGADPFPGANMLADGTVTNCSPQRANFETAALITHTAAAAGANGADQQNVNGRGVAVFVNITAITGTTPTLTVTLQGKDPVSGVYYTILASAALNATGFTALRIYPGIAASANVSANDVLPRTWRVITTIAGTTPAVTATVSAAVVN